MNIQMDVETFIELLEDRREFIAEHFGWTIPDVVWNFYIDLVRDDDDGIYQSPKFIVDNMAVNGDYVDITEVMGDDETMEEAVRRLQREALVVLKDGDSYIVVYGL